MHRTFFILTALIAAGSMSTSADALSLGLGSGKGGLINTGGGNGGLINVNTGGGSSDSGGSSGVGGTVNGVLSGGTTQNDVGGVQVGTNGPSPTGTGVSVNGAGVNGLNGLTGGANGLLNNLFGTLGGLPGGDPGNPQSPTPLPIGGEGGGIVLASFGGGDSGASGSACFMPNAKQMATLFNRHDYAGNWAVGVTTVKVVKVPMCTAALAKVAAAAAGNPNVLHLEGSLATSAWLTSQLSQQGVTESAVVGADRKGGTMVVYVI